MYYDIVMSNEPFAEYGNEAPKLPEKAKLDLKNDECIVSYLDNGNKKYLLIKNISAKEPKYYPSAPSREL